LDHEPLEKNNMRLFEEKADDAITNGHWVETALDA
jgi:hypothetical protein